ncbi:sigma-E factor negative regulatory protein RseC [uncultured Thiomicrorhabdus sp.]|jgi:sigma-E factor negative regulatory protein RseC
MEQEKPINRPSSMLTETATVVALETDADENHFALLEVQPKNGCSGCASSGGCGTSALSQLFVSTHKKPIKVRNYIGARVGDRVEVSMDQSRLIKHSFMAYGLPLIGLLLFAVLAQNLALSMLSGDVGSQEKAQDFAELWAIAGAGFGLFSGWWITRKFYRPVVPEMQKIITSDFEQL